MNRDKTINGTIPEFLLKIHMSKRSTYLCFGVIITFLIFFGLIGFTKRVVFAQSADTQTFILTNKAALIAHGLPMTTIVGFTANLDPYEPDDTCLQATTITTDGVVQSHTIHQTDDIDWVGLDAIAGETYFFEATTELSSTLDLVVTVYASCQDEPLIQSAAIDNSTSGVVFDFKALATARYYIKIKSMGTGNLEGSEPYKVLIRKQPAAQTGAVIIVAGRRSLADALQTNIHHVTNNVYSQFRRYGYSDDEIHYLATDPALPGYDAPATAANLQRAIQEWAVSRVSTTRYLTLYIVNSGEADLLYLDKVHNEEVTTEALHSWLEDLETAVPGVKVNIILEQCYAGSFIAAPSTISKPGRLIITSTDSVGLAFASENGAAFSDPFVSALSADRSFYSAFLAAQNVIDAGPWPQTPQLDGNGNGVPNEAEDENEAQRRVLFIQDSASTPTPLPPTATLTATFTPSPSPTPSPTPNITPTPVVGADSFEADDTCGQASAIPIDGTIQRHTFHRGGDVDWIRIPAQVDAIYQIDIISPEGSLVDAASVLMAGCNGTERPHDALGPGIQIRFRAEEQLPYYLKLRNTSNSFGAQAVYEVAVREVPLDTPNGLLILVAGRNSPNDLLQPNINEVTNHAYQLFQRRGYSHEQIYYISHDATPDSPAIAVDGPATRDQLEYAITQWAAHPQFELGADSALTLYLVDHGNNNEFLIDGITDPITPGDLDRWLAILEQKAPGVAINIIIDACYSGSFIAATQSLSRPGRVVITSTANSAVAYVDIDGGTLFSNYFLSALERDFSLYHAFSEARRAVTTSRRDQTAWLDDNGNGIANEATDGAVSQKRGFAFAGTLSGFGDDPPQIASIEPVINVTTGVGTITVHVRSKLEIAEAKASFVLPDYVPPVATGELLPADQPTITLVDVAGDGIYSGTYDGFVQSGVYRIVVSMQDNQGNRAQPMSIDVAVGQQLFLPMIRH